MCDWNSKSNKEKEAIFEEIEGTNFPDLIKDMNWYITLKLHKKILKINNNQREKNITCKGITSQQ